MFQKILVALNQSPASEQMFEEALALAKTTQARLLLLHVLAGEGYPMPIYPGTGSLYSPLHEEAIRAYTQQRQTFEQQG